MLNKPTKDTTAKPQNGFEKIGQLLEGIKVSQPTTQSLSFGGFNQANSLNPQNLMQNNFSVSPYDYRRNPILLDLLKQMSINLG